MYRIVAQYNLQSDKCKVMVCIWYLALFAYDFMYAIYECYGFCVVAFSEDIHSLLSLHWYKISKRQLHDQLRSMFTIPNTF